MLRLSNTLPTIVLAFCFLNVWRAYFLDTLNILVAITLLVFVLAIVRIAKRNKLAVQRTDILIFIVLVILMFGYALNYQGEELLKDIFLYHVTAMLFLPFLILMKGTDISRTVLIVFSVIFCVDCFVIIVELLDGFIGLDLHKYGLFDWYINVNDPGRFLQQKLTSDDFYSDIPHILGLRGYPNYTAPLFTASFLVLLSVKYGELSQSNVSKRTRFGFLLVGTGLIFLLGVKTHMVTLFIGILVIGKYLDRSILNHLGILVLLGVIIIILNTAASQRFDVVVEQLFVGGYQAIETTEGGPRIEEPGRLELIFNFGDYAAFLDLTLYDFLFGAAQFSVLERWEFFFEQKIVVIGLVLGAPFVAIFLIMALRALSLQLSNIRFSKSDRERGLHVGVLLAILTLVLEVGHFGATFYYPNYQVMGFLIAVSIVAHRYQTIQSQHPPSKLN